MSVILHDVFADTTFWIALVIKQDQYHAKAQECSQRVAGRIITTVGVLLETANALARPNWRAYAVALIDHLHGRQDVVIHQLSPELWERGGDLYRQRPDKAWSLTDCVSFLTMQDNGLSDALTADEHFRQAGFRALLLENP
ncbi:MAG: type II toxin-antitoxin system VapC family toxin [Planctomycetes bacterium]|nr:type II toxin-antitoxin system VapC family toxin [Planctomycetota bacterium]